ncbi:MAG: SCO family protein [Gammaproteobacteria bacterium]|nr:SCO family protein [Gammaproteobacteria bacterium]
MLNKATVIVFALIAMAAGFWLASLLGTTDQDDLPQIQGAVLTTARQIAVPQLVRHDDRPFTNADLSGQWTLMFYGYASCPDICPMTMNALAEAKQKASVEFPQVVMVSVDPQRDRVELLGEYVRYFDPDFIGVTGDEKMIQALALQMSVVYAKMPGASGNENDYLVDHSSSVLLINPEGKLAAFLKAPHTPDSINGSVAKVRAVY